MKGCIKHGNEPWASYKSEEPLNQVRDYCLPKTAPVIWLLYCITDFFFQCVKARLHGSPGLINAVE